MEDKNIYFISDVHLGSKNLNNNRERELHLIKFIDSIKEKCSSLWLMGDIFDFWFEYKHAVPKGHTRLLGKLSELHDNGIEVNMFIGNHDIWIFDYLTQECGVKIHKEQYKEITLNGKLMLLGHGDGLNPKDIGFKIIRKVFHNPVLWHCAGNVVVFKFQKIPRRSCYQAVYGQRQRGLSYFLQQIYTRTSKYRVCNIWSQTPAIYS